MWADAATKFQEAARTQQQAIRSLTLLSLPIYRSGFLDFNQVKTKGRKCYRRSEVCVLCFRWVCFASQKGKELEANSVFHKGRSMRVLQNYEGDRKEGLDRPPLGRGPKLTAHTPQPLLYYYMNARVCTCMHVFRALLGNTMLIFGPAAFTEINTTRVCVHAVIRRNAPFALSPFLM